MAGLTLGQKQELFARLVPKLLLHAQDRLGFHVRIGEVLRFEQQARWNAEHCRKCKQVRSFKIHGWTKKKGGHRFKGIGIVNSLHRLKLAIDLILFLGKSMLKQSEDYRELGMYWESLHPLCYWGGRFGDGGHFSIQHGGRK